MDHVAGYCVAHDVSARDLQLKKNGGQWLLGKTFDTFCPIGPALVTTDEISGGYFTCHSIDLLMDTVLNYRENSHKLQAFPL